MADAFLDRLLAVSDVQAVLSAILPGGRVFRGDEWAAACPYCKHDDQKDPKFSVNLTSTVFKCFKCNETGNVIRLAQMAWGRSWQKDWALASPASVAVLGPQEKPPGHRAAGGARRPSQTAQDAWEAATEAARVPGALSPLAAAWVVGEGWLLASGIVPTKNGTHPCFGFPAYDPATGAVVDLKRRILPPIPEGVVKSQSWPGGKAGLFGFSALSKKPKAPVLVTEGEKDWAVASHDLEDYAVVGVGMGAGCFGPTWAEALRGRDVVLGYDPDKAGRDGAAKAATYLNGVAASVRLMPPLFDPTGVDEKGREVWSNGMDLFDFLRGSGESRVARGDSPAAALRGHLAAAASYSPPFDPKAYVRGLIYDLEETSKDGVDWTHVAEETYKAMNKACARWLQVEGEVWCIYRGGVCRVAGSDPRWRLVLYDLTNQTSVEKPGQVIAEVLKLVATRDAVIPDMTPAWCVRKGHSAYMALNDEAGRQVRITPESIEIVDNGADGVVTFPYETARPIRVLPDADFDRKRAEEALDRAVSYFACSDDDRAFLKWYILTLPLYPFAQSHPVLRFRGDSGSGKSTCAKAITTILYGLPVIVSATNAALYRLARRRAVTAIDNLEDREFRGPNGQELQNFVLVSATGRAREKSAQGTDSSVVREEVKSLFLSTGIEPIGTDKPEINNRTIEIHFDRCNAAQGFYEEGYLEHLKEDRDLLWNLAFRVCRDALSDLKAGAIQRVLKGFPPQKQRLAEFFSILSIAQSGDVPLNASVRLMLGDLDVEERAAMDQGSQINTLFLAMARVPSDEAGIPCSTEGAVWRTDPLRAQDLFRALSVAAKRFGLEMPWKSAHAMATRLNDETVRGLATVGVTIQRGRQHGGQRVLVVKVNQSRLEMEAQQTLAGAS